ncbi:MAG: glycosyltransferase family 4 protein [Thermoanaerobaculia bacterium]
MRLAIVTTHPIQYQVPWFRALAARREIELTVGFAWLPDAESQGVGFGVPFHWDVPLTDGYRWERLPLANRSPRLGPFFGLRLREVASWLRAGRFEALLVTGWNSFCLVQAAREAKRLGLRVMVRGDSSDVAPRAAWKKLLHRRFLSMYDAFLTVGSQNEAFYARNGVPASRRFRVPHVVDNQRLAEEAKTHEVNRVTIRGRWGIEADARVALFAGKMIREKNLEELLRAFALAEREERTLRLLLVGDGPLRSEIAARAESLEHRPALVGFLNQSRIAEAYAAADFLVLPSRSETWGLVVNEAMACGLPAIVSDRVGCAADLVREGETGAVYASGDVAGLAARLAEFARDPGWTRAMGVRAQALVFADYSIERAVEGTLAALEAAAAA